MLRSVSERLKLWCLNVQIAFFLVGFLAVKLIEWKARAAAFFLAVHKFVLLEIYVKMRSLKLWNILAVAVFPPKKQSLSYFVVRV